MYRRIKQTESFESKVVARVMNGCTSSPTVRGQINWYAHLTLLPFSTAARDWHLYVSSSIKMGGGKQTSLGLFDGLSFGK